VSRRLEQVVTRSERAKARTGVPCAVEGAAPMGGHSPNSVYPEVLRVRGSQGV